MFRRLRGRSKKKPDEEPIVEEVVDTGLSEPEPENPIGIVVIGNLEGDRAHDTPREMVRKALKRNGFKVVNLGKNVPVCQHLPKLQLVIPLPLKRL